MSTERPASTAILGAGCAGLSCAQALVQAGQQPLVIDKARGVGGRCATRRFSGQPVDFGALFYHGSTPEFLEALEGAAAQHESVAWPEAVEGEGRACLARAFEPHERRMAFRAGMTAFPKSLAQGTELRLETRALSLRFEDDRFTIVIADGDPLVAESLVLALPAEQAAALLDTLPRTKQLDSARALLGMVRSEPCLTVVAGYPLDTEVPTWDVYYPDEEPLILAAQDSRKRLDKSFHAFVYQCSAKFSRSHLEAEPADWMPSVLDAAARLFGSWVRTPEVLHPHRWRYGRASGCALSEPWVVSFGGRSNLALAGDVFDDALGTEGAFRSGWKLANLLVADTRG